MGRAVSDVCFSSRRSTRDLLGAPYFAPPSCFFFCFVCVLGMRAICSLFNDPFLNTVQLPLPPRGC